MTSSFYVRLHPYVLFQITDAHERRPKVSLRDGIAAKNSNERDSAFGCLLGSYDRDSVIISNSFVVKMVSQVDEKTKAVNKCIDLKVISEMRDHYRLVSPSEQIIGWYSTAGEFNDADLEITNVMERIVNLGRPTDRPKLETIILLIDCPINEADTFTKLNPRAYIRKLNGIPKTKDMPRPIEHVIMLNRLPLKIEQYRPERVLTELLTTEFCEQQIENKHQHGLRREIHLTDGASKLHVSLKEMSKWIENIRNYVDKVIAGQIKPDPKLGRKLMDIVNTPTARMAQEQLDKIISGSIRDHLMIAYLSQVAETQMAIYEKMVESVL